MLVLGVCFAVLACVVVVDAREGASSEVAGCRSIHPLVTDAWCGHAGCAGEYQELCSSSATDKCSCAADDDACFCDEPPVPSANCNCRSGVPHINDTWCQSVQCHPTYLALCVGMPCKSKSAHVTDEDCDNMGCPSDVCECSFYRPSSRSISAAVTDAWCAEVGSAGEYKELCETVHESTFPPTLPPSWSPSAAPSSPPTSHLPTHAPTRCAGGKCCTGGSICYFSTAGPEEATFTSYDALFCCKSGECVARPDRFMLDQCTFGCLASGGINISSSSTLQLLSSTLRHCYQDRMPTNWGCTDEALAASSHCGEAQNKVQCAAARDCIRAKCPLDNNRLFTSGRGECSSMPAPVGPPLTGSPVGPPITRAPTLPPTSPTWECLSSTLCDPKIVVPTMMNRVQCCKGGQTCHDWYGVTGFCSGYQGPFPPPPTPRPTAMPTMRPTTHAPTGPCGGEDQEGCVGEEPYQWSDDVPACPADLTQCCYGSVAGCSCEGCGGKNGCQVSCAVEPAYPPEEGFDMAERGSFVVSGAAPSRPLCKAVRGFGPPPPELRCFDLSSVVAEYLLEALNFIPHNRTASVINGFEIIIIGLLNVVIDMAKAGKFAGGFLNRMSCGFCAGEFNGKYVLEHKGVGRDLQLYRSKCHKLMLHPDVDYTIISVTVPAISMQSAFCAASPPPAQDEVWGFCFALTTCGTEVVLPDFGLALNKFAVACWINKNEAAAASGGISTLVAKLGKEVVDSFTINVATSGHMGVMVDIYTADGETSSQPKKVWAVANLGFAQELAITEESLGLVFMKGWCGVGKSCIRFELNTVLLIGFFGHALLSKQDQIDYVLSRDPETDIAGQFLFEHRFQQSVSVRSGLTLNVQLSKMTRGVVPDLKATLAQATVHLTGVPKSVSGIPRGAYLWLSGADVGGIVAEAIIVPLIKPFSNLINAIFNSNDAARKIINTIEGVLGYGGIAVGIATNGLHYFGAYLKLPIAGLLMALPPFNVLPKFPGSASMLGQMIMDIRFPYDGGPVYFKLDFDQPRWFGVIWDGLMVSYYEVKDFFDTAWKFLGSSKGRGRGTLPNVCKAGYTKYGGLCYPKCNDGYYRATTMCVQRCPSGWRDDGLFCAKPKAYPRGAGKVRLNGCKGDRESWGLVKTICYKKCAEGFYNVGCCICSPRCPSGMIDFGVSCIKDTYDTGVGILMGCGSDKELQDALCYKPCEDGQVGRGPVCWSLSFDVAHEHRRRRVLGAEHGGPFTLEGLYRGTQDHPIWNSNQTVRNLRGERGAVSGTTWWNLRV